MSRVYHDYFVVTFTIDPGPPFTFTKDDNLKSYPAGPVVWVVCNFDSKNAYTVEINYDDDIKHKGKKEHPLQGSKMKIDVDAAPNGGHSLAAGVDLIKQKNPNYTYQYTAHLKDANGEVTTADPDLEVVDPFPLVKERKALKKNNKKKRQQAGASKRRKSARRR
jgi:hypothetical protein